MTRYRGKSNFDPMAHERLGPPTRPYNWVQWTGVAFISLGLVGYLAFFAKLLGWIPIGLNNPALVTALPLIGAGLINARRAPGTPVDELQRARNRKVLLIIVAVLAALGTALLVIQFSGAR